MKTLDLNLAITLVSALSGIVAAVFAALAYFGQLVVRRKKGTLRVHYVRNHSNVSITATNEGRVVRVNSVYLEPEGMETLRLDNSLHTFKDGAPIDISVDARTFDDIPVDVESRVVLTLSDGSALRSRPIRFAKILHAADETELVVDITLEN